MALKEINVGDLVVYGKPLPAARGLAPEGPGVVLDKLNDVPIGWLDDEVPVTEVRYRVYWQDQQTASWYWEDSISRYEETGRGEQ